MNPNVDWFFNKPTKWQEAYSELRTLVLDCKLEEFIDFLIYVER